MNPIQVKHDGVYKTFHVNEYWNKRVQDCVLDARNELYDELIVTSKTKPDEVLLYSISWE